MGGGLGSPPPLASPCKAAFRLMWRCFVLRTNICREKTEFQLGVEGWRGRGRRRLPVFTKQITLATVTANVDSPPLPDYFFANFKWKKNIKCLNAEKENGKWFSTCCCLKANLNMHELEMVWKSLWFSSDRDISEIEMIVTMTSIQELDGWPLTMTKVFMMIWVHIGRNRIKLASWSVRHVRD